MDDWLVIMLYLIAAAVACGLRHLGRNLQVGEEDDGVRTRLLDVGKKGKWLRKWLLPGEHTHDPGTPEIKGEDEQWAHVARETVGRPRKTWAKPEDGVVPTRSQTTLRTPMYRGRPARLWWLPEQAVPEGPLDAVRGIMLESMVCPGCGEANPADSAFCDECGAYLRTRAA